MKASIRFYLFLSCLLLCLAGMALSGCASRPPAHPGPDATTAQSAHPGLRVAMSQLGAPYRYGGSNPQGFDCSGLVYYAFRKSGVRVPRTTGALLRAAQPVPLSRLHPGDLLFFRLSSKVSHVGIYAGDGWFIHAPSDGKQVSYDSMRRGYWKSRLVVAGRYDY